MKTNIKYLAILIFAVIAACKKDSMPTASEPHTDAYARMDNPANDVDHQIFLLYQQSNIPLLYSDTLRKTPLNVVNLNYTLSGSNTNYVYTYPKNKVDILNGIAFVKNQILPPLNKIKMYSITLLDTLKTVTVYSPTYSVTAYFTVLPGLTTFGIANIPKIQTMTATQLSAYKADIFTNIVLNPLNASDLLKSFNAVSANFYNKYAYGTELTVSYVPLADKRTYGLIPDGTESPSGYSIGSQTADLKLFLTKTFTLSASDFQAQYGAYPLIMSKYNILKTAITTLGFDLTKI
jgi:hypothetical protein